MYNRAVVEFDDKRLGGNIDGKIGRWYADAATMRKPRCFANELELPPEAPAKVDLFNRFITVPWLKKRGASPAAIKWFKEKFTHFNSDGKGDTPWQGAIHIRYYLGKAVTEGTLSAEASEDYIGWFERQDWNTLPTDRYEKDEAPKVEAPAPVAPDLEARIRKVVNGLRDDCSRHEIIDALSTIPELGIRREKTEDEIFKAALNQIELAHKYGETEGYRRMYIWTGEFCRAFFGEGVCAGSHRYGVQLVLAIKKPYWMVCRAEMSLADNAFKFIEGFLKDGAACK
jgi:hypothetical protein